MKKIWIGIGIISIIALFVGVSVYRASTKENIKVETTQLTKKEMTGNVMIPGTLELNQEQKVYLDPQLGEISEILVKEGDEIKKGTPLLKYVNEQLTLEKEQNQLAIDSSYIRINQIKKQIENLEEKRKDLEKQIGKESAKKQIETEKSQLETEKKMANIELKQQLLQKEAIEKKLKELEVKSDIDGVVVQVNEDNIDHASQQSYIIHIANLQDYRVKGVISEYDSLKIKVNQPVTLSSDVIPNQKWKGTVTKVGLLPQVNDMMNQSNTAVQYPIEVKVEDTNITAKPGFQLIMEIETDRKKVNTLPLDAVKQEDGQHFVFIVESGKVTRKDVEIGIADEKSIEIKKGLNEDDFVILNSPTQLKVGMEVTVK